MANVQTVNYGYTTILQCSLVIMSNYCDMVMLQSSITIIHAQYGEMISPEQKSTSLLYKR